MSPSTGPIPLMPQGVRGLEGDACGQLNVAWTGPDIDDLAELRITDRRYRIAKSRPVEGVEGVHSDLYELAFAEGEAFEYAEVL